MVFRVFLTSTSSSLLSTCCVGLLLMSAEV